MRHKIAKQEKERRFQRAEERTRTPKIGQRSNTQTVRREVAALHNAVSQELVFFFPLTNPAQERSRHSQFISSITNELGAQAEAVESEAAAQSALEWDEEAAPVSLFSESHHTLRPRFPYSRQKMRPRKAHDSCRWVGAPSSALRLLFSGLCPVLRQRFRSAHSTRNS